MQQGPWTPTWLELATKPQSSTWPTMTTGALGINSDPGYSRTMDPYDPWLWPWSLHYHGLSLQSWPSKLAWPITLKEKISFIQRSLTEHINYLLRTEPMPIMRWPIQTNSMVLLEFVCFSQCSKHSSSSFFFFLASLIFCLYIKVFDFIFYGFLCVQICVCV